MEFVEGKNCGHVDQSTDFAVFVDGAAYFEDLALAFSQAEHTIYIAGWAIDPRTWLRADAAGGDRLPLQTYLRRLVAARPQLQVYILIWDMARTYRFSTNPWSIFQKGWIPHPRVRLIYDDHYPSGGCQHQKFVVIDDCVAYCGGIDLTVGRWDTPEHVHEDPRRIDAYGLAHPPFHDVQARVINQSAAYLGRIFRIRWRRVSFRHPRSPQLGSFNLQLSPGMLADEVAVSRTDPVAEPSITEVFEMAIDLIGSAQETLYIENQYLTSRELGSALAKRLMDPNGPEVIIVGPRQPAGWVEEATVGILRWRVVDMLRGADQYGRLRIYYPMSSVAQDIDTYVHAKVLIVDDRLVRIGSSNISRRSLSLDIEVDITAKLDPADVRALRARLLAEHLGVTAHEVETMHQQAGTLCAMLDELQGQSDRTLIPLGVGPAAGDRDFAQDGDVLFDPAEPWEFASLAEIFAGRQTHRAMVETAPAGFITISTVTAFLTMWRLFFFDLTTFATGIYTYAVGNPLPAAIMGVGITGLALSMGMSTFVMMLPLIVIFGPIPGLILTWIASMVAAGFSYFWGKKFGRNAGSKLFGVRVEEVRKRLFSRGFFSVVALRALPISSFATVGFAAGAAGIPTRPYGAGTAFGIIPNLMFLGVVAQALATFLRTPTLWTLLWTALSVVFVGAIIRSLIRAVERRENRKKRGVPNRYAKLK